MAFNFPQLDSSSAQREYQEQFAGYNHNIRIGDTEFYDMQNMTGNYYPVLSPRDKRGIVQQFIKPKCMASRDNLCYIDGMYLYIDGEKVDHIILTDTEKQWCQWVHTLLSFLTRSSLIRKIYPTGDILITLLK